MRTVYLETTIPSYLAGRRSKNLIVRAHQKISHQWWATAKERYRIVASEAVREEIRMGDPEIAKKRLSIVRELKILALTDDVQALVHIYRDELGLPSKAGADLLHIAFSVSYKVDYLVTWNCKHIANGEVIRKLLEINKRLNRFTPLILTPEELLETSGE